jgi:UDP-glucose 4-epimerase
MNALVTGGAGFIGSNLVDRLLADGHTVTVYDNLSTGQRSNLKAAARSERFWFEQGDLLDRANLIEVMNGHDIVFHLAASPDVRSQNYCSVNELEQNVVATANVLEAMLATRTRRLVFCSTGAVYGEARPIPTPEDAAFPVQTSIYGASKLAAEGLIAAYCKTSDLQAVVLRFVSIIGKRCTHNHLLELIAQLQHHPHYLSILGTGRECKTYLDVSDCVAGILHAVARADEPYSVFNLGSDQYCELDECIRWICEELRVRPRLEYALDRRGLASMPPFIFLDTSKLRALGWRPRMSLQQAVRALVQQQSQTRPRPAARAA